MFYLPSSNSELVARNFMLSAVIFDLDGVVADSEPWRDQIDANLLADYGVKYCGEYARRRDSRHAVCRSARLRETSRLRSRHLERIAALIRKLAVAE
jgi:beta-phosphoglucomutase-like phosphatase (HAD superfamily)